MSTKGRSIVNCVLGFAVLLAGVGLLARSSSGSVTVAVSDLSAWPWSAVHVGAGRPLEHTDAIPDRAGRRAGGLAFINSIAHCRRFVGPFMMGWMKEFSGYKSSTVGSGGPLNGRGTAASIFVLKLVIRRSDGGLG